jgi:hypothetical protein
MGKFNAAEMPMGSDEDKRRHERVMECVPRGEKSSLQNYFRMSLSALLQGYLSQGIEHAEDKAIREATVEIRKQHPEFEPEITSVALRPAPTARVWKK